MGTFNDEKIAAWECIALRNRIQPWLRGVDITWDERLGEWTMENYGFGSERIRKMLCSVTRYQILLPL